MASLSFKIITAARDMSRLEDEAWLPNTWDCDGPPFVADGSKGVLSAYQQGYELYPNAEVIAYYHDDVRIDEPYHHRRFLAEFQDPSVGIVGYGGAKNHGHPHLYKVPYNLQHLARSDYYSNVDDAEEHGTRFTGEMDVAVLDGFALIIRRELLDKMGGWQPDKWMPHHIYDYRACAEAHRPGYRVRCIGVRCHHFGGRTATTAEYQEWCKTTKWGSDVEMHKQGHRMFYDVYKDVMPWNCP